jgi:hypothetical protein
MPLNTASPTLNHAANLSRRSSRWMFIALATEFLVLTVARLPYGLDFDAFAFSDIGSNFTIQSLVAIGQKPGIDFGYHYGLLPILVGKIWFTFCGMTPIVYQALMVTCGLVLVWVLVQIAVLLQLRAFGKALIFIGLGFAIQVSYPNLAHILESTLLALALYSDARGHRDTALAFASAGLFCKPSMSYVYGLVLVILITMDLVRSRAAAYDYVRAFAPAAITTAILTLMLAILYSPASAIRTILPVEGAIAYRDQNFGFFHGIGRTFWNPPNVPWIFYLIDFSGFWIASSIFLVVCGAMAWIRWYRRTEIATFESHRDEIIWTCAILHLSFVFFFFGNKWSWICYSYLLILGIAVAADLSPTNRRIALLLCVLGLSSWIGRGRIIAQYWHDRSPSQMTAGLWAPPDETAEWRDARAIARGHRAVVLETKGGASVMFPEFDSPVALYLDPGLMEPSEIQRQVEQLAGASIVVVSISDNIAPESQGIPKAPEIERAMMSFDKVLSGKYLDVYRRRDVVTPGHSAAAPPSS